MPIPPFQLRCLSLAAAVLAAGCWKDDLAPPPEVVAAFDPVGGQLSEPWQISSVRVPGLVCPDGEDQRFTLLYPESAVGGAPMPAAALYHAGAFDFVFAPSPSAPLDGTHFADPSRLHASWATRQVYATLGLYTDQDVDGADAGSMPLALAENGIAVILPENCWGDLWHNAAGIAPNDVEQDFFLRDGRSAADWAYRLLADPTFASFFGVALPITVDPASTYLVGLGSGGRAVGEVLSIQDADGSYTFSPAGAVVDSSYDDLGFYFEDPTAWGATATGLQRLFLNGADEADEAALFASARLPDRTAVLFSDADPSLPQETFAPLAQRMSTSPTGWLYIDNRPVHGLLNRADGLELARNTVTYLLTGVEPPSGPGVAPIPD